MKKPKNKQPAVWNQFSTFSPMIFSLLSCDVSKAKSFPHFLQLRFAGSWYSEKPKGASNGRSNPSKTSLKKQTPKKQTPNSRFANLWFSMDLIYCFPGCLIAKESEIWWLEDAPFLLGRYIFRGELINFRWATKSATKKRTETRQAAATAVTSTSQCKSSHH